MDALRAEHEGLLEQARGDGARLHGGRLAQDRRRGVFVDVAVIGVPHERWRETVKAIAVRRPGAEPTPEGLIDYARERLARYKCPTSVDFVEALPRNPSGKLLKRELREPYWKGHERRIH